MAVALLFDLDGTLVLGDGAGSRAMLRAVQEWTGCEQEPPVTEMAGRTDPMILRDLLGLAGEEPGVLGSDFMRLYLARLEEEVSRRPGRLAPGVGALLERCAAHPDVRLALATGNVEQGARIKLEPHGLNHYFPVGGYGSDSASRDELVQVALQRARQGRARQQPAAVAGIVVGDTPRDVAAAKANGIPCIAVATGPFDSARLAAAGADRVFEDLTSAEAFFEAVWALARLGK